MVKLNKYFPVSLFLTDNTEEQGKQPHIADLSEGKLIQTRRSVCSAE